MATTFTKFFREGDVELANLLEPNRNFWIATKIDGKLVGYYTAPFSRVARAEVSKLFSYNKSGRRNILCQESLIANATMRMVKSYIRVPSLLDIATLAVWEMSTHNRIATHYELSNIPAALDKQVSKKIMQLDYELMLFVHPAITSTRVIVENNDGLNEVHVTTMLPIGGTFLSSTDNLVILYPGQEMMFLKTS